MSAAEHGLLTLTTDFGVRDGYVAALKGSILSRAPALRLVDVTHEIEPGAIASAAFVLGQAAAHFPGARSTWPSWTRGSGPAAARSPARSGPTATWPQTTGS